MLHLYYITWRTKWVKHEYAEFKQVFALANSITLLDDVINNGDREGRHNINKYSL